MDSRIWQICSFKFVLKIVNNADQMMCNAYRFRQFGFLVKGQSMAGSLLHSIQIGCNPV